MLKGYGSHATQLGYHKKVAVPMTQVEKQLLLHSMHKTCNSCSTASHQHMLLLRDGYLACCGSRASGASTKMH